MSFLNLARLTSNFHRCPTCFKGKLQIKDADPNAIACPGYYDEDIAVRISCGYTTKVSAAPRLQPWYSSEPTDEEIEAMKAITDQHEKVGSGKGSSEVPPDLLEAAENLDCEEMGDFMELDNRAKAQALVDLCTKGATKIDLPQDEKKARQAVGKILMNNLEKNAVELLKDVMEQFGMVGMKEDAKAKQKSAIGSSCTCAANAGIVQAFQELKDYYFKDGNSNAGGTVSTYSIRPDEKMYEMLTVRVSCFVLFRLINSTKRPSRPFLVWTMKSRPTTPRVLVRVKRSYLELVRVVQTKFTSL